jgi:hypothetical protein
MNQDMADRSDQSRKGHDKCAGSNRCLQFHTKKRRKNNQHHHAAARTDKTCPESDRQSEKERDDNPFKIQPLFRSIFLCLA